MEELELKRLIQEQQIALQLKDQKLNKYKREFDDLTRRYEIILSQSGQLAMHATSLVPVDIHTPKSPNFGKGLHHYANAVLNSFNEINEHQIILENVDD